MEEMKSAAIQKAFETIRGIYPDAINLQFEHEDAAGYWFTFETEKDARRQNIRIRHDEIKNI